MGYRLFDTAAAYFNESALGNATQAAIAAGTVKREDLFLTTKVWLQDYGHRETRQAVQDSLENLQTDYLDLVLLHQPFGNWQEAWETLEELQSEGLIRAIGTSNFTKEKLEELLGSAEIIPQVNQMEIHPFYSERDYTEWLREKGIQPEAWGPLCEGLKGIFTNPVLSQIGEHYGKSAAQVALRWSLQQGNVIIPQGKQEDHCRENLEVCDFELSEEDMEQISKLDLGHSEIIDFHSPATERLLLKWKIHS